MIIINMDVEKAGADLSRIPAFKDGEVVTYWADMTQPQVLEFWGFAMNLTKKYDCGTIGFQDGCVLLGILSDTWPDWCEPRKKGLTARA